MPEDALQELVRTGALVRTDQVREGADGEWQSAAEIPGLFAAKSDSDLETPSDLPGVQRVSSTVDLPCKPTGLIPPVPPRSSNPAPLQSGELPSASERSVVERPVTAATTDVSSLHEHRVAAPESPENDLISAWKLERNRSKQDLGMVSLAAEMTQAQSIERQAPAAVGDEFNVGSRELLERPAPADPTSRASMQRPAFLDQVPGLEADTRQVHETSRQDWDRLRRSLPGWRIATALIVVILAAWWFWPRSQRAIYDRYVSLWSEWKVRRVDSKDQAGWDRFMKRTDAELNEIVPWLEKNTPPHDNERKLLLFIGRDCLQKMRAQPRQIGSTAEKQLEMLLKQVHELYEPSAPPAPRDAFIGAKSVPPKNAKTDAAANRHLHGVSPEFQEPSDSKSQLAIPAQKPSESSTPP